MLMKYGDNREEALVRAINDTKDNDTIVGAAVYCTACGTIDTCRCKFALKL